MKQEEDEQSTDKLRMHAINCVETKFEGNYH